MDQSQINDLLNQAAINPGQIFFLLFGGPEKFDCWLSRTADEAADPIKSRPASLPSGTIPPQFQALMQHPLEAVDFILDNLEILGVWKYKILPKDDECLVIDEITGHVVQALANNPENLKELQEKYQPVRSF